jgi:kynureninase
MEGTFIPAQGADAWQLSNAPVFIMAPHLASLQIFEEAGIQNLRQKSLKLTAYLEYLIQENEALRSEINILTPSDPSQRGCQLSLEFSTQGKLLFEKALKSGIIADWREPSVMRIAPVPLYNTFYDVWQFVAFLKSEIN